MSKASEQAKKELLDYPFVVAVGHERENDKTVLKALVEAKKPESELDPGDVLPKEVEGVEIDVEEVGELGIEPITPDKKHDTGEVDTTARQRPAPHGVSTGHVEITAGTDGFVAWGLVEMNGVEVPQPFTYSNNHVYANENEAEVGDPIVQPGPHDGGINTDKDTVAELAGYVEIIDEDNLVDLAWARVKGRNLNSYIPGVGVPTDTAEVSEGDEVKKFGRTTGLKKGKVLSTDARVRVRYDSGLKEFEDQVITESISAPGDSGSAVVDSDGDLVGLLFAGSDRVTVCNKARHVLNVTGHELQPGDLFDG